MIKERSIIDGFAVEIYDKNNKLAEFFVPNDTNYKDISIKYLRRDLDITTLYKVIITLKYWFDDKFIDQGRILNVDLAGVGEIL